MKKKSSVPVRVLKMILGALLLAVLLFGVLILVLTVREWKPADREALAVQAGSGAGEAAAADATEAAADDTTTATEAADATEAAAGGSYRIMTWNIGYGALGDNADFFMDGGKMVKSADKARVTENLESIIGVLKEEKPDFVLMQEVDESSTRSSRIDEVAMIGQECAEAYTFALNFNTVVPYPVPPIGPVRSGILTLSNYGIEESERVQLPIPFSWPVRVANLKRCLSINRVKLPDAEHDLVLINLHLEAYDSGEGKRLQTEMLRSILDEERAKGNYIIAGGDFNQLFSEYADEATERYPIYEGCWQPGYLDTAEFGEGWQFVMDPSVPTCRSLDKPYAGADKDHFQYYLIDGLIASDNIEITRAETMDLGFTASDHNPVVMDFSLKP